LWFQVTLINFDNMRKSSAIILNYLILQGTVATQIRWRRRSRNSYIEFPWESVSKRIL